MPIRPYHSDKIGRIYVGDCVQILQSLPPEYFDLCFADPPFNIGHTYDLYDDQKKPTDYITWTDCWFKQVNRVLKPTASIFVCMGTRYQAEVKVLMDRQGWHWRNTIVWHYTFGPAQRTNFTPSWVAIHYYTKSDRGYTFNDDSVRVPSQRQLRYNDKRANPRGKLPDNVWVLTPDTYPECFRSDSNCQLASRVAGTFKERTDHPCQMPISIVSRLVQVSTNKGDVVIDPFLGSGTTYRACQLLERKCWGIELSEKYAKEAVSTVGIL